MGGAGSASEMDLERRYGPIGGVQGLDRISELCVTWSRNNYPLATAV